MKFFASIHTLIFVSLVLHSVVSQPTGGSEDVAKLSQGSLPHKTSVRPEDSMESQQETKDKMTTNPIEDIIKITIANEFIKSPEKLVPEEDIQKELTAMLDRAEEETSMEVVPGVVSIERTKTSEGGQKRGLAGLGDRVAAFLRTHALQLRLPSAGNVEEGRGRLKRLVLPFLLLLKLVAATLIPIFMSVLALISLKGMWNGAAAVLVAGALGLRELLVSSHWSHPPPRVTVLRPHIPVDHVYHGGDYFHHGWSRNGAVPAVGSPAAASPAASYSALDPYRGYGPSSGIAPVGSVWDARL